MRKALSSLANYIWEQEPREISLQALAASLINVELGVANVDEALEGARHILAETISENADIRKTLRKVMFDEGVIVSSKMDSAAAQRAGQVIDEQQKFKMYYDYREPVRTIPSHRMLAIRRGEAESVLYFLIELDPLRPVGIIKHAIHKRAGDWTAQLDLAAEDSWKRLLNSSITRGNAAGIEAEGRCGSHQSVPR